MLEIRRLPEPLNVMIQILQPIIQHRVIMPHNPHIGLEMLRIHCIESHHRRIRQNIQLRQLVAEDIRAAIAVHQLLEFVQRCEEGNDVLIVPFLRGIKPGFVYAGTDQACKPRSDFVDLGPQILGVKVQSSDLGVVDQGVECVRKPLEHLHTLIVDDAIGLLVPKKWDTVLARISWVIAEVQLVHEAAVEEMVGCRIRVRLIESPA